MSRFRQSMVARGLRDDNSWLFGDSDEFAAFWDRMEEYMEPLLLQQVGAYICGDGEVNPLLGNGKKVPSR